jgi:hypothetical protein
VALHQVLAVHRGEEDRRGHITAGGRPRSGPGRKPPGIPGNDDAE